MPDARSIILTIAFLAVLIALRWYRDGYLSEIAKLRASRDAWRVAALERQNRLDTACPREAQHRLPGLPTEPSED